MKLKNLLYLAQLEEYDISRIEKWLKENPNKTVYENKKKLIWTSKAKIIYFLSHFIPLITVLRLLSPLDNISKAIFVNLAKIKLILFHPKLTTIVITGSWGKTTTKDYLFEIIKTKYQTVKTLENYNTLLGISKAVLKLPISTQIFICEAGAYYPGDIKNICRLVKPKIGVLTAVGPMHLERFGSLENILKTKMELAQSLPGDGLFLLPKSIDPKSFNLTVKNIIFFDNSEHIYKNIVKYFDIKNPPKNNIFATDHRLQITQNGPITIIDDSYNSNPAGFELALKTLKAQKVDQKILVTPGMIELGSLQFSENARLAKLAGHICDLVIIVGKTNQNSLLSGLKKTPATVYTIDNLSETEKLLPSLYKGTSAVLFENDLGDQYF